jgi:ribonuclease III
MSSLQTKITICESIITYDFTDEVLCAKALSTYAAWVTIQGRTQNLQHNSHMAVYGDAVSASYLCRRWLDSGLDKGMPALA